MHACTLRFVYSQVTVECTKNEGSGLVRSPNSSPPNDVVDTGPLGGKQCRQTQLNDHKHNKLVVTVYTGITIQTLVLYYVVKCAGFTHAHRCIHKHTQILHSADRTRQLPTLRRVSSLNTISCQLCAEQTRVMTRVHEAILPSLSLTLIQLLSTMHPGSSSYTIPSVQLMSTIFFSFRDILFILSGRDWSRIWEH